MQSRAMDANMPPYMLEASNVKSSFKFSLNSFWERQHTTFHVTKLLGSDFRAYLDWAIGGQLPKYIDCILIYRRSIHSYKVTETTRKTVTKDKDGNVTEDVSIDKTTTETDSKVQPAGRMARLLKVLPGILMLLILAALAYYVTAVRL